MLQINKINELTPEQEARLPEWREKWLEIGLSCEPLAFDAAKKAASKAYLAAGLTPPQTWLRFSSPVGAAIGLFAWAQVGDQVWDQVWTQVGDQVGDQVWAQVGDQVRDLVWAQVWAQVGAQVGDQVYGSHDASWLSFYHFLYTVMGLESVQPLTGMFELAQVCGWWAPYQNVCALQDRHSELYRDPMGRLHNENGPAVLYRDGWGVYVWHGVRVPQQVIEAPNTLEPHQITDESNTEIRRIMLERFGYDKYLAGIGAQPVHTDQYGTLFRSKLDGDEDLVVVQVTNGTPDPLTNLPVLYHLRVPPSMESATQAVAWTYNMQQEEYQPTVRT